FFLVVSSGFSGKGVPARVAIREGWFRPQREPAGRCGRQRAGGHSRYGGPGAGRGGGRPVPAPARPATRRWRWPVGCGAAAGSCVDGWQKCFVQLTLHRPLNRLVPGLRVVAHRGAHIFSTTSIIRGLTYYVKASMIEKVKPRLVFAD